MDHEVDIFRTTVNSHSQSYEQTQRALKDVYAASEVKGDLNTALQSALQRVEDLDRREQEHWEATPQTARAIRKQHDHVESLHLELRSEVEGHVARLEEDAHLT